MSAPLFRKEAIQNNTQRLFGDVLLIQPISFWIFVVSITLLVILVGGLLMFGSFTRSEMVTGYLVPDKGVIRVYAPYPGLIETSNITEGQSVQKDEHLLEITTERFTRDSLSTNQQLIARLQEQQQNLDKRIHGENLIMESEYSRLSSVLSNYKRELLQIKKQLQHQEEELQLQKTEWETSKKLLKKGLISNDQMLAKQQVYYRTKSIIDATKRQQIQKQTEIINLKKQIEQSPLQKENRLQELENQNTVIQERLIELQNSNSYSIKAPINGRVTVNQTNIGKKVVTGIPVLSILPEHTKFYAELFLPSRAIGFVQKGQKVFMRYDAFPYQRYGLHKGTIIQVAEAVISPSELTIPLPTAEPVYRIKVELDQQSIEAYGKEMPLQSGMAVTADIVLEERSLGQWLLEPIYSLKGKL